MAPTQPLFRAAVESSSPQMPDRVEPAAVTQIPPGQHEISHGGVAQVEARRHGVTEDAELPANDGATGLGDVPDPEVRPGDHTAQLCR